MGLFRLKSEACQFFDKKLHGKVKTLDYWINEKVSELALERVKDVWVSEGIQTKPTVASISSWSSVGNDGENQVQLNFSLNAIHVDNKTYKGLKGSDMSLLIRDLEDVFREHIQHLKS